MFNIFKEGQKVKFNPNRKGWEGQYSLDGVRKGDTGVVTYSPFDDEVWVNFTRSDGTICDGFCAFPEDLEVVGE